MLAEMCWQVIVIQITEISSGTYGFSVGDSRLGLLYVQFVNMLSEKLKEKLQQSGAPTPEHT